MQAYRVWSNHEHVRQYNNWIQKLLHEPCKSRSDFECAEADFGIQIEGVFQDAAHISFYSIYDKGAFTSGTWIGILVNI